MVCLDYTYFFISNWASDGKLRLNLFLVSNNINYILKKSRVFICNKHKVAIKLAIHHNSAVSKALLGKL